MSAANEEITLTELERLIKLLGLLASTHDGEVLAAARHAVRWVAEKGTDWQTLLTPEPLPLPVAGVAAPRDPDVLAQAAEADRVQAFKNGYQAGMADMARQLRAQAVMATGPAAGQGRAYSGFTVSPGPAQGAGAQGPVAGSAGPARAYPASSWQAVAMELLARHASVPGVLRSREEAFVQDILQRGFPNLTQAQEDWLRAIAARSGMLW